jgi:hypothetical protein
LVQVRLVEDLGNGVERFFVTFGKLSMGVLVLVRVIWVAFIFVSTLAACHHDKRPMVRIAVFQDYVSVNGVRLDMPIQQAIDEQTQRRGAIVVLIPQPMLNLERQNELARASEKLNSGIGIRKVAL